ncbi:iron-sulfur cluster-binding protein [candidate division KSB1 bacterium]|nr:iron-sulfur cluster-binding protein [candidate division KSB1 bacterium]NIV70795.1 iron-sulfur cluster-binding protein [Phycisphaerae bacterium]NIR72913.1 iron-sulfur cluster-binding protein [candidate division KSB1 bacterium]NIT73711.1 iron-sulfur cluster-binding protein [candidate division KSB1 bacterium]NIU27583.1 iron-sulfur cluster-binding protein [candidate division KSB1 bacterium]
MTLFTERAAQALNDGHLQVALNRATTQLKSRRTEALSSLEDVEQIRDLARNTKLNILSNLGDNLLKFEERLKENGVHVHWAAKSEDANAKVVEIAKQHHVKKIVKSKSMVTEEIRLNASVLRAGFDIVETDLGEYIVQLAEDHPSHIIVPIIHKTREDVGRVMQERLGVPFSDDPEELAWTARRKLRREFLNADMGITGANFGVVETGTICLVTNEGNGRMVTSLPKVHIVLMGIEKLLPTLADLDLFLKLLARSATGQKLTVYTTLIHGPRREGEDGPQEVHVILLDNGRSRLLAGELAESLACIRCGACLNVCPIYKNIGGHAYGDTYAGPIGSVITPGLRGLTDWSELPAASTLCGACREVCPLRIDIPRMLLALRQKAMEELRQPAGLTLGMKAFSAIAALPRLYRLVAAMGRWLLRRLGKNGWVSSSFLPIRNWTKVRDLKTPAKTTFQQLWQARGRNDGG